MCYMMLWLWHWHMWQLLRLLWHHTVLPFTKFKNKKREKRKRKKIIENKNNCYIPNSETFQLQYNIKSLQLFGFICIQNSISGLVLYNILNPIKILQLFGFIWVKIYSHLYMFLLPNYLLQTPQNYSDFTQSFLLSKSKLLFSISLLKHSLRDLF